MVRLYKYAVWMFVLVLFGCSSSKTNIKLENNLDVERADEPVVIGRAEVEKIAGVAASDDMVPSVLLNGKALPSQVDDLDHDGKWDEFAFLYSFKPKEQVTLTIKYVKSSEMPVFKQRTNVRLGVGNKKEGFKGVDHAFSPKGFQGKPLRYQSESVAWENDKMAFRNYFDIRNAKDLFGKLTEDMILDNVGAKGNYHQLNDWGMDVLHVGASLGSGGLALCQNDSLYRLGSTDVFEFTLVSKGPVRSIFDLDYKGWHVENKDLEAKERVTIWGGHYWFKSDVTVKGANPESTLAVGIVTSYLKTPTSLEKMGHFVMGSTLDKQSENKDNLGMGILIPTKEFVKSANAPEATVYPLGSPEFAKNRYRKAVTETFYLTQKLSSQPSTHYFFAVWEEENKKWASHDTFKEMMKAESERIAHPIAITYNK
ncbi:DUF4861 domain-containing protein [Halosquirtibacter xylanolyticus]|uniref:DUF4861 domain-containing protein n=1 Tax=Halosquirtibacter xylanolyticus TaxID=3374599 RepID=UPI00374A26DB|nr:DUF4861 domain-containing protein [Prolixibacteraceae bacterium]